MKQKLLFLFFCVFATVIPWGGAARVLAAPGDLYEASFSNQTIFKFTPSGTKTIFATVSGTPGGLAFDRSGNLFVSDSTTGTIFTFSPDGIQSVFASGLTQPAGLAFDASGNLFAIVSGNTILKISSTGTTSVFASGLANPSALAFDSSGNLFVADASAIFRFTPTGTKTTFASGLNTPHGLAFDSNGNLFVTDFPTIYKFTPGGTKSIFNQELNAPWSPAFDGFGNFFVAEDIVDMIFKFPPIGDKSVFASGLQSPELLAFEPSPRKLVNVSARGRVQTGDDVLIGGFILGGSALNENVVVLRAIGPSLSQQGIANSLQDPTLELRNASGALIASNDNWQTTQGTQISATGLAPSDSRESAIYAQLGAGNYTAIVRGAGGTTGVALVEVYNIQ